MLHIPISEKVEGFYKSLENNAPLLPNGFRFINPYNSNDKAWEIVNKFYQMFYNDNKKRRMILGSSPARRGSAVTGVPFEDAEHLNHITGVSIVGFQISKASSDFLYDVMEQYGGCNAFYANFYMSFVCPLGIVKRKSTIREVNCNYYETATLVKAVTPFIVDSLKKQLSFGFDTSVCYCIGSGENFRFLSKLNEEHEFFRAIVPLEHPRYIMQYNPKQRAFFLDKYLNALQQ